MTLRKILSILICAVILVSVSSIAVFADDGIVVNIEQITAAEPGEVVTITVSLDQNPGLAGIRFDIEYDDTRLELLGATQGDVLPWLDLFGDLSNISSPFRPLWFGVVSDDSTGVLLYLEFRVLADAQSGLAEITADNIDANCLDGASIRNWTVNSGGIYVVNGYEPNDGNGDNGGNGNGSENGNDNGATPPRPPMPPQPPLPPRPPDFPNGPWPHNPEAELHFTPLPFDAAGHWSEDYIRYVIDWGVMAGYPDGTFQPNGSITRAEFSAAFGRLLFGSEMIVTFNNLGEYFYDTVDHWAEAYINIMAHFEIVNGVGDNLFAPGVLITREQIGLILYRSFGEAVDLIMDREYVPQNTAKRGEIAAILIRLHVFTLYLSE
ncbi:MAG: S-layer homology domain-containing protein [Oscillospiraceae bacterium]|nr:S-layer homology domain-containing protein [Oscillospiraceae bacterium]